MPLTWLVTKRNNVLTDKSEKRKHLSSSSRESRGRDLDDPKTILIRLITKYKWDMRAVYLLVIE